MRNIVETNPTTTIIIINQFEMAVSMEMYIVYVYTFHCLSFSLLSLIFSLISTQLRCIYMNVFSFFLPWLRCNMAKLFLLLRFKRQSLFIFLQSRNGLNFSVYLYIISCILLPFFFPKAFILPLQSMFLFDLILFGVFEFRFGVSFVSGDGSDCARTRVS